MSASMESDQLREEGNALYKAGKLEQAIIKYKSSATLASSSSAPLRNLSAAYFETGDYRKCIATAEKALKLVETSEGEDADKYRSALETRIGKATECLERPSIQEQVQRRVKIMKTMPRYKPSMFSSFEHYAVGHDDMSEIFDESLEKLNRSDRQKSFLFAGIGDARHMYRMFWDIYASEERGCPPRRYHWSIIDINKYALTRDLIIFLLLSDLSNQDNLESDQTELLLATIYYIFAGSMMPPYAFEKTQHTISRALDALKNGTPVSNLIYLHKQDVESYIQVLGEWQGRALKYVSNEQYLQGLVKIQRLNEVEQPMYLTRTPAKFRHEKVLYTRSGLLYPPRRLLETREPNLRDLMNQYPKMPKKNASYFREYISKNWTINPTLISLEWVESEKEEIDLSHDPFLLQGQITTETRPRDLPDELAAIWLPPVAPGATSLFDQVSPFFLSVAKAMKALEGRAQVEVILGDFIDTAERMRHGLYRPDDSPYSIGDKRWPRPEGFPCLFDRIHLSNIPDYIGGHLSSFLFAIPLLKRVISSRAMSNCLRNSPRWSSMDDFVAHYQCIQDEDTLKKLTQTNIIWGDVGSYPLAEYAYYFPSDTTNPSWKQDYKSLLDRKAFTKWFYALFFQLALPSACDIRNHPLVILAPLNLTVIFRMISHLRNLGYPSHWLSEILLNIIQDNVVTTSRPPRTLPTTVADLKRLYPFKKLCTTPFKHEMATLTQLFHPLLPFSLSLSAPILPPLSNIHNFHFTLSGYQPRGLQPTCLCLAFWDPDMMSSVLNHTSFFPLSMSVGIETNFRCILDPSWGDEVQEKYKAERYKRLRESGVVIWTSFRFDVKKKVASVWMDEGLVREMERKGWQVGLLRTDVWQMAFDWPELVKNAVVKGERWIDWKDAEKD